MQSEGRFRSCGRYRLVNFEQGFPEPVAVVELDGETAGGNEEAYGPAALAILIDSQQAGEEQNYLGIVHAALEELAEAVFRFNEQFQEINGGSVNNTQDAVGVHVGRARALLESLRL